MEIPETKVRTWETPKIIMTRVNPNNNKKRNRVARRDDGDGDNYHHRASRNVKARPNRFDDFIETDASSSFFDSIFCNSLMTDLPLLPVSPPLLVMAPDETIDWAVNTAMCVTMSGKISANPTIDHERLMQKSMAFAISDVRLARLRFAALCVVMDRRQFSMRPHSGKLTRAFKQTKLKLRMYNSAQAAVGNEKQDGCGGGEETRPISTDEIPERDDVRTFRGKMSGAPVCRRRAAAIAALLPVSMNPFSEDTYDTVVPLDECSKFIRQLGYTGRVDPYTCIEF